MSSKTSKLSLAEKALKLSISNLWRNKFLSIATIFVMGTIIFIFNIILAINFIAEEALDDLSKKIDVIAYVKESTTYEEALTVMNDLKEQEGVENAHYTSKEDAINQIEKTHPEISSAFSKYDLGNPLPASINITTTHPDYHPQVAEFLAQPRYSVHLSNVVTSSEDPEENAIISSVTKNLLGVTDFAKQIIFWLIIIFVIGGALIVFNALQITIFNRKQEISVMKLVGASHWFIRLPFIIESIIYGLLALGLSFLMLLALSQRIQIQDTSLWQFYTNIQFYKIFLAELVATISLSIISSMLAVHEHLQTKLLEH